MNSKKGKMKKIYSIITVLMIIFGVIGSWLVKTSFQRVELIDMQIPTNDGTYINATIFRPKSATSENPAPVVIACHGYCDSAEKQDITAIELSRRGIVVIEMNAYSHGLSSTTIYDNSIDSLTKECRGILALVEFVSNAQIDYMDNSQIGVTGHSMGGNASRNAITYYGGLEYEALQAAMQPDSEGGEQITDEEMEYAESLNLISAAFLQSALPSANAEDYYAYRCNVGMSYCYYDEGAYRTVNGNGDMTTAQESLAFVNSVLGEDEQTDTVEIGRFYGNAENGTLRVVYNPKTIHPYQYMYPDTATGIVEFFMESFQIQSSIPAASHTFMFRYVFSLIALIGLFMLVPILVMWLLDTSFFGTIISPVPEAKAVLETGRDKILFWGSWAFVILLSVVCYEPLIELSYKIFPKASGMQYSKLYNSFIINFFSVWVIFTALVSVLLFVLNYHLRLKKQGWNMNDLGLRLDIQQIGKALLLAICVMTEFYVIVFTARYFFHTEFQYWNLAAKVFTKDKIWMFVQYLPFFFLNMVVLAVTTNTTNRIAQQKCNLLINVIGNVAGPSIVFVIAYGYLFTTGSYISSWAGYRDCILVVSGFVALTAFATIINRKCFEKTGSIWVGAFISSFLITMLQAANTATLLLLH